ncbi:MAG: ATP-binding protein [Methanophagales archaeon ANME-1-THS]|nr:MAG: ATP-binding protein [Methanophagales archaeon ANME-1-THS]
MIEIENRLCGIIGQRGTGKSYLTKILAETKGIRVIAFDTLGILKIRNAKPYSVIKNADILQQGIAAGGLMRAIQKQSISFNLSELSTGEIIQFTDSALRIADFPPTKWFFFDEIAEYVPESSKQSQELLRLIRLGRNRQITVTVNTQRPAFVSKKVWELVDVLIIHRLVWKNDLDLLREVLSRSIEDYEEIVSQIPRLRDQERILLDFRNREWGRLGSV